MLTIYSMEVQDSVYKLLFDFVNNYWLFLCLIQNCSDLRQMLSLLFMYLNGK